ncbi:MAG: hypothetical protein ACD_2C00119G0005 [uncultured bacterium (gcode 4)]|uniref:Uncharacterized protein n=1 Tax=uncultured bacterium (gcode 4) TaxID=1234023 RepID=K2GH14_9BACT|nr:MAG: hypothetical protein ACD_2C00119G0005 [uncultured bacterium (gcode 4)]
MELFMNTQTKACSIHLEHINSWVPATDILRLEVTEDVFRILTKESTSLADYTSLADDLIRSAQITSFIKNEFAPELAALELSGAAIV